jgi:hypothetical protein
MALPDFARVIHTYEQVSTPLGRWLSEQQSAELGTRLQTKSAQLYPRIMVYGNYNAGKSTLLNALMGRAEAKMADRPETAVVTEYPWGNYTLLDTPGIDAPIEHEEIADEQLRNSEVVLFVVAAGGATDEARTWERLVDIVASDRRVMLIVNNKAGITVGDRDYVGITDGLRNHLQRAASERGIEGILEKVSVQWVNARSALKGRLEDKQALVVASGILELEEALGSFLEQSDVGTIYAACRKDLVVAIEQANLRLVQAGDNRQAEALTKAQLQIENERTRLTSCLNDNLDRDCRKAKQDIINLITLASEGQPKSNANQTMEEGAAEVVQSLGDKLMFTLECELPKTQQNLSAIGEKLAESTVKHADAMLNSGLDPEDGSDESFLSPAIKEALKKVPMGNVKDMTEQGVKAALELGKEFLPKLFKGIGPKTMGRWASTAGRWAGPLVQVSVALYDIYQAIRTENAEKEARARRTRAIDDSASAFVSDLRQAYQLQITLVVEQVFKPMDEWIALQDQALVQHDKIAEGDRVLFDQALIALRRQD